MTRSFRFICEGCNRSLSNQTAHQNCNYCNHDHELLKELGRLMRTASPARNRECDIELACRAWVYVCERQYPQHLDRAKALLAKSSTHIQLDFGDLPKVPVEQSASPTKPEWDDDEIPF